MSRMFGMLLALGLVSAVFAGKVENRINRFVLHYYTRLCQAGLIDP